MESKSLEEGGKKRCLVKLKDTPFSTVIRGIFYMSTLLLISHSIRKEFRSAPNARKWMYVFLCYFYYIMFLGNSLRMTLGLFLSQYEHIMSFLISCLFVYYINFTAFGLILRIFYYDKIMAIRKQIMEYEMVDIGKEKINQLCTRGKKTYYFSSTIGTILLFLFYIVLPLIYSKESSIFKTFIFPLNFDNLLYLPFLIVNFCLLTVSSLWTSGITRLICFLTEFTKGQLDLLAGEFRSIFQDNWQEISNPEDNGPSNGMFETFSRTMNREQTKSDRFYAICEQHDKLFDLLKALNSITKFFVGFIVSISLLEVFLTTYQTINPKLEFVELMTLIFLDSVHILAVLTALIYGIILNNSVS